MAAAKRYCAEEIIHILSEIEKLQGRAGSTPAAVKGSGNVELDTYYQSGQQAGPPGSS